MYGRSELLLILLVTSTLDVVEAELVRVFSRRDNATCMHQKTILPNTDETTDRIQSRSEFFLRNFFVRYLRYRLDKGMLEATVSLTSPEGEQHEMTLHATTYVDRTDIPSRVILTLSPSCPVLFSTLMRSCKYFSKAAPSKTPSPAGLE